MLLHVITCHHSSSIITPDHPKGRCPFWVNFSSILGGSRDHLGVILGSSFKGSRGVPNMKKMQKFWVFGNMSRDPPGGLLGPLGGFSLCRCYKILKKKKNGVAKSVQPSPDLFFQGWAKNAPGRVLDRFWEHQNLFIFLANRQRENPPRGPRRPPGGSLDMFPKTQKIVNFFIFGTPENP